MPDDGIEILGKWLGYWKILLSSKALKSIQSLGRSGNFGPVEQKVRDLASGSWSCHLTGSEEQRKKLRISLAATQCNPHISILWQVDVASDETAQTENQVIKICGICAKTELPQLIDQVILLQKSYSNELVAQCRQKPLENANKNLLPRHFPGHSDATKAGEGEQGLDIRTVDRAVLEMANRFYVVTEPMIRSVLANDLWAEFPFDLSGDETQIILHHATSSLILGRSGTGKTTCLVFKLLAKLAACRALPEERTPRKLLLTRSNELANRLKDYIEKLMRTFPAKVNDPRGEEQEDLALPDVENDDKPDTIFNLQDDSAPLVCTFDRLLELLENTIKYIEEEGFPFRNESEDEDAVEKDQSDKSDTSEEEYPRRQLRTEDTAAQFVDFQSFKLEYWPKFPPAIVKNIPIELAFAEIMGVIKGSISSRETLKPLSREAYYQISSRLAPTFTLEAEKTRIYDLFEKYQALKLHRQQVDGIDRVTKLIKAVRETQVLQDYLATKFDEIYVDEVQDLRCLDIELLLSILKDGRAFHFAGDTAQTISHDSHFRFQDIKALFFDHFNQVASLAKQPKLSRPHLSQLAKNYRSHQGILGLASLIMDMLWCGFPETVDKLQPEIGHVHGPIPVFFLNCSASMLSTSSPSSMGETGQALDFGAEQAIIVRDHSAKAKLQAELKDQALILTVLQSKGMEFDDVLLWNFFTDSPCPGGWRCLDALKIKSGDFDSKKYAAMCSELKQFYVAVTRARIRLSIIESQDELAARVVDILTHDASSPLVEMTKSSDPSFLQHLLSLRAISHDPERWSDRGHQLMQRKEYCDAAICFRRAKDKQGETCATAHIMEERGRHLASIGHMKTSRDYFRSAVQKFVELKMVAEAVRTLERMDEYEEAAWLWAGNGKPGKAAPLFSKAGIFKEASDNYHRAHHYDNAAAALRQGDFAQNFVLYVTENQSRLSPTGRRSHSRFCIRLLKEEKICRLLFAPVIRLLGSPSEQERALIAYEMHDELADLYADQGKWRECFLLVSKMGKLGRALKTIPNLHPSSIETTDLEGIMQRVQDYHFSGKIICQHADEGDIPVQLQSSNDGWISAQRLISNMLPNSVIKNVEAMGNGIIKDFLRLHLLFNLNLLEKVSRLAETPFDAIDTAFRVASIISSLSERNRDPLALLLAGVMEVDQETKPFILLPWSPLHEVAANLNANEYPRLANEWFLLTFGKMMLRLDENLKSRCKSEWRVKCANFLTQGNCKCDKNNSEYSHEKPKASECNMKVSLLIKINTFFCQLTALHRKQALGAEFQSKFLPIRRSWLERLLRELIFVSSFEQSSQAIMEVHSNMLSASRNPRQDRGLSVLAGSIEGLLFHRLSKEWIERNDISSLFEQVQVSQILDYYIQDRFSWYLGKKLSRSMDTQLQFRQLQSLQRLESTVGYSTPSEFRGSLRKFTDQILRADINQLSSFHSVTTIFEFFTAYLTIRSCRIAVLIPQSWINLHFPWFAGHSLSEQTPQGDLLTYAACLIELTTCYCELLSRLGSLADPRFRIGLTHYPPRLLYRRSLELVALVIVNLGLSHIAVKGFSEVRQRVSWVMSLMHIRGFHLQHTTVPELLEKVVKSHAAYDGKDCIKFARKTSGQHAADSRLQRLGIQTVSLAELLSTTAVSHGPSSHVPPSNETEAQSSHRVNAAEKIQRFWRSHRPTLLARRTFLTTSVGRLYTAMLEICKQSTASKTMRYLLTGRGIGVIENIHSLSRSISELQGSAGKLATSVLQEKFERVDELLERLGRIEESLEGAAKPVSMDRLEDLAKGDIGEAQSLFQSAESELEKVERGLLEARKMKAAIEAEDAIV